MTKAKKTVQLEVSSRMVDVTMQRHHWSKQLRLSMRSDGRFLLSVPKRTPWHVAESFLQSSKSWVGQQTLAQPTTTLPKPTNRQRRHARELIERKLQQWGPAISLNWDKLRIADQKTRWGSCSAKGTLSFSWRLSQLPQPLVDYVVVHELCHLVHMNHSREFWLLVEQHLPQYKQLRAQLKQIELNGRSG